MFRPVAANARAFSTTSRSAYAKIQVIGRLAAQPELVDTSTGNTMVKYTVASDFGPKDNRQTSWWRVANFQPEGAQRDFVLGLPKGTLIHLDAEAQLGTYDDEGKIRQRLNLVQRSIEVLARPKIAYENNGTEQE
ncbi:ssDNA binding protein [Venturia nashicola]|nr:ssDNA binding protein [Venturia nashicola]